VKWSTCGGVVCSAPLSCRCSAADDVNWQGRVQSVRINRHRCSMAPVGLAPGGLAKASYCRDGNAGEGEFGQFALGDILLDIYWFIGEGPVEPVGAVGS